MKNKHIHNVYKLSSLVNTKAPLSVTRPRGEADTQVYPLRVNLSRWTKTFVMAIVVACIASSLCQRTYAEPQTLIIKTTCYSTGKHVASKPYAHPRPEWIAISHKLEKIFPMFSYVKVCGKVYQVRDRMPYSQWRGYRLDIYNKNKKFCDVWGVRRCVAEFVK